MNSPMHITFDEIKALISCHEDVADFVGVVSDHEINRAEQDLGVRFPDEYRTFLKKYGCGSLGAEEIFGVGVRPVGIPSAVWATLEQRNAELDFPPSYVVIYNAGLGELFCLDTKNEQQGHCSVISWRLGAGNEQKARPVAETFFDFLHAQLSSQF